MRLTEDGQESTSSGVPVHISTEGEGADQKFKRCHQFSHRGGRWPLCHGEESAFPHHLEEGGQAGRKVEGHSLRVGTVQRGHCEQCVPDGVGLEEQVTSEAPALLPPHWQGLTPLGAAAGPSAHSVHEAGVTSPCAAFQLAVWS